jgi:hypothetical protein
MWFLDRLRRRTEPLRAQRWILAGNAPRGLHVRGGLDLSKNSELVRLPAGLAADRIVADECPNLKLLPPDIRATQISLQGCTRLRAIGAGIRCRELYLRRTAIDMLPCDLQAWSVIDLQRCTRLRSLPEGLQTGRLILRGCTELESLPERLHVAFLDISDCPQLMEIPAGAAEGMRRLVARNCSRLCRLPANLNVTHLDVSGCERLGELPEEVRISSALDLAGTAITSLPASLSSVWLYWRGVPIDRRTAFSPETITAQEILHERNLAMRRVLLERMGLRRFIAEAQGEQLDADEDRGGPRLLVRIPLDGEDDLVCVIVRCPSTGQQYVLRVPPQMRTCRQAIAWTAGVDVEQYQPLVET